MTKQEKKHESDSKTGSAGSEEDSKSNPVKDDTEPTIRLDHFLQACGVETGGQAKLMIQGGLVKLNGEVETRRRKKLRAGDEVDIDGDLYDVALDES